MNNIEKLEKSIKKLQEEREDARKKVYKLKEQLKRERNIEKIKKKYGHIKIDKFDINISQLKKDMNRAESKPIIGTEREIAKAIYETIQQCCKNKEAMFYLTYSKKNNSLEDISNILGLSVPYIKKTQSQLVNSIRIRIKTKES